MTDPHLDAIRSHGWSQGSILEVGPHDDVPEFLKVSQLWVVASHPCDVVARDFEAEPIVELIAARRIVARDGNFAFGANPRRLHAALGDEFIELDMAGKCFLERKLLASVHPAGALTGQDARAFPLWLAARYSRSFFADTFNERRRPAAKRINQTLKRGGVDITAIYVMVQDEELDINSPYEVSLLITVTQAVSDDIQRFAAVDEIAQVITRELNTCAGIVVVNSDVKSELEVPIQALRSYRRLDFDHYTIKGDDHGDHLVGLAV